MTDDEYDEWIVCGRLPHRANGRPDYHKIERALRCEPATSIRVALLKRVAEIKTR